jgi:hypothetical protein
MNRLILRHLALFGPDVETASVEFGTGVTVVRGPSDTGKSFIVDAIDFMLGAKALKEIPERDGYSTVLLGMTLPTSDTVTLARAVTGGDFGLYHETLRTGPVGPASRTLSGKHSADNTENLSRYLLSKLDLDQKRVRRNQRNETDSLSFRNVASLCVVDETAMQSETPPALSGRPTDKTKEISTLRLLLQNEDDSNLVAVPSRAERNRLANAKVEVLDRLLAELEEQVNNTGPAGELRTRLDRLSAAIHQQTSSLAQRTTERAGLVNDLAKADRLANAAQRSIDDADVLKSRFQLLLEQYTSDLKRLEMVAEAGTLLGYFNPGRCVFCGADPEHQHLNEDCDDDTTYFGESVLAEQRKTTALRNDLLDTLEELDAQQADLSVRRDRFVEQANEIRGQVRRLDSALAPHQGSLNELLESRSTLMKQLAAHDHTEKLQALKIELATEGEAETAAAVAGLRQSTLTILSEGIAARLQAWGVPDAERVRYDRAEQDVIAGDQLRSAHGKGVRAILHAAFTIALAQYCFDRELPHPGFVILDSPLVTYRPPEEGGPTDADDVLDASVAARFYADIQHNFDGQVIIMENTDPPSGLNPVSMDIPFTKNASRGRYGFFPHVDRQDPPPASEHD